MLPSSSKNRYLLVLAVVAVTVLIVGWRLRPERSSELPASQADISQLQRLTQRTNLDNMATYFAEVADRAKTSLVWVERLDSPGIVWEQPGSILAPSPPEMAGTEPHLRGINETDYPLLTDLYSESPEFRLMKAPPELALVSVQITPAGALRQGTWLVLLRRTNTDGYEMQATLYTGSRAVDCGGMQLREMLVGLSPESRPLGAAAFDLEGRFFGASLQCDGVLRLISAESLGRAIDRARAIDSQLLFRYGFRPAEMSAAEREYFGRNDGLLVREVWRDSMAWDRGIRPGDLCVTMDGEPLARLDDLAVMTVPMYRPQYALAFRRGRADRTVVFPPGAGLTGEPEVNRHNPVTFASPLPAVSIHSVEPHSLAARAGLLPGDRIISTGPHFSPGRATPDFLSSAWNEALFLVVERGHALHGLFLPPLVSR